jgi:small GTP-binding protein
MLGLNCINVFKVVLMGDSGSGKPSFINRFYSYMTNEHIPTIDVEVRTLSFPNKQKQNKQPGQNIEQEENKSKEQCSEPESRCEEQTTKHDHKNNVFINVWDTAGDFKYKGETHTRYSNANIIFFDITDTSSYDRALDLADECSEYTTTILVGNKCDLLSGSQKDVIINNIKSTSRYHFIPMSVLSMHNFFEPFDYLINEILIIR